MRHCLFIAATLLCLSGVASYVVGPLKVFDKKSAVSNQRPSQPRTRTGAQAPVDDSVIYFPPDEDHHSRSKRYVVGPLNVFDKKSAVSNQRPSQPRTRTGAQAPVDDSVIYFPSDEDHHSRLKRYVVGPLNVFDKKSAVSNQRPSQHRIRTGTQAPVDDSVIYYPSDEDQHSRSKRYVANKDRERDSDSILFPDIYPQTAVQSDRPVRQESWERGPQVGWDNAPRPWGNQGFWKQSRPGGFPNNWGNGGNSGNNNNNNQAFLNRPDDDDNDEAPFVFDRPPTNVERPRPGGRPRPSTRPPNTRRPTTTRKTTTLTTPRPPGRPMTTPTPASTRRNCNCPTTPEFNPVCGQDRVTYSNPGKLRCANFCGNRVQMLHYGACITTTTAPPPS